MPLTDTHLVLLSAASQRADALLPRPNKVAGAALQTLAAALVKAGLAELGPVRADQPHWRIDEDGSSLGLKITRAGLLAIGVETSSVDADPIRPAAERASNGNAPDLPIAVDGGEHGAKGKVVRNTPRAGTKLAGLVALLSTDGGSTLDELVAATGWLPHTTRAALTRLRQSGHAIRKAKDDQNRTVYRITEQTRAAEGQPVDAGEAA